MCSDITAIQATDISKRYEIYEQPQQRLKQFILPRLQRIVKIPPRQYYREFWALKDITFEVNKGESVGIIGRNGAGKSTLLQIISGMLTPTSGRIEINGTVAALLELGSGFNPEFTGRENVYLNASLLGLSTDRIDAKFDEIAAFADIGNFIDVPVKTYSSGMLMRLAFAVNACIEPEILIVDEALSVGDAPFQSKCFKRLRQLIEDGTSILFVSHDISTVRSICSRALWLKQGHTEMWGESMKVVNHYEKYCWSEQGVIMETVDIVKEKDVKLRQTDISAQSTFPDILFETNPVFEKNRIESRTGTGDVIIRNFLVLDNENKPVRSCRYDERLKLYYLIEVSRPVSSDFILGFRIRDLKGNYIYSANDLAKIHKIEGMAGEQFVISTNINLPLTHQDYVVMTGVFGFNDGNAYKNGAYDFTNSIIWDVIEDAAYIKVEQNKLMPLAGPVHTSFELDFRKLN